MNTVFEMPLRDITLNAIQDLQNKFPSATLRIETNHTPTKDKGMNVQRFWKIICLLDWRTSNPEKVLLPAIYALSRVPRNDIKVFHDILNEKLFALDTQRFAEALGSNHYAENNYFSVDVFLYSRCCVVANGEQFYHKVLENPDKMPKEYTFEALLTLPQRAWHLKTGKDNYDYFPQIWCETFSNTQGWEGRVTLKESVLSIL